MENRPVDFFKRPYIRHNFLGQVSQFFQIYKIFNRFFYFFFSNLFETIQHCFSCDESNKKSLNIVCDTLNLEFYFSNFWLKFLRKTLYKAHFYVKNSL